MHMPLPSGAICNRRNQTRDDHTRSSPSPAHLAIEHKVVAVVETPD
jgi:hypothetical protein